MGSIAIVGIGLDDAVPLPQATLDRLRCVTHVIVSGGNGALKELLAAAGIAHRSLQDIGLPADAGVDRVIERLAEIVADGDVAYVTAGYPFLRHGLLSGLLARTKASVDVFPRLSPLQVILMAFDIDLTADLDIVDARSLTPTIEQRSSHLIVTGVRNRLRARRVADRLAEVYAPDHEVVLASRLPDGGFALSMSTVAGLPEAPVEEDAAVYVGPWRLAPPVGFAEFVRVIGLLRGSDGCPWDQAQNHLTLRRHMIEEAYEAVAAIESGDPDMLAEELGDVLLQVVLHARIAAEDGSFTIDDVIARITEKIRRRHPHVFGEVFADTPEQVTENWDSIKRGEKQGGLLEDIAASLPALLLAQKISRRVVGVGFEWDTVDDIWSKVHEEIDEIKATEPGSPEAAGEIGDLLFTVVNLARKQGIDAEEALKGACAKFASRWHDMEVAADREGTGLDLLGIEGLERLWGEAKRNETREA